MKTCTTCNILKDNSDFGKQVSSKDGISWTCKKCKHECDKEYNIKNRDKLRPGAKIRTQTWRQKNPGKAAKGALRTLIQTTMAKRILKDQCVKYKGGKCSICGYLKYNGAMDFHHIDRKLKKFDICAAIWSNGRTYKSKKLIFS